MVPARRNPFADRRVLEKLPFDPAWCGESWQSLEARLESQGGKGLVHGPHGSGKTTLLDALEKRLANRGIRVERVLLNDRSPRRGSLPWEQMLDSGRTWFIDGAERLGRRERNRLVEVATQLPGLVATVHEPGLISLPHLLETRSTPEMLETFIRTLAPDFAIDPDDVASLFSATRGNLREALWRCYDRVSEGTTAE